MDLCWFLGQKSRSYFVFKLCTVSTRWPHFFLSHTMMIWLGQEVKGKGYICVHLMFELLIVCVLLLYYLLTYNYDTSHMCFLWAKEDLYLFWGQAVMVTLESLNLFPRGWGLGGVPVPLKHVNFKWMWVGSRLNDIYVYTLPALVYSLHHVHYQWKFEPIRCD